MPSPRFFAREEFFGWLLFDTQTHQYVVPVTAGAIQAFRRIVEDAAVPRAEDLQGADGVEAAEILRWLSDNECAPGSIRVSNREPKTTW